MQVTIKNVDIEWGGKAPKKWGKAVVEYTYNGEPRKQNVMSFSNPDVFKKVQEMVGQVVEVEVIKNDKGFNEWKSITAGTAASNTAQPTGGATATRVSGSNFETKEERAARQVLIVKQSSLTAAIATLSPGAKTSLDPNEVKKLAQDYADWVFEQKPDESGFDTMEQDIPF